MIGVLNQTKVFSVKMVSLSWPATCALLKPISPYFNVRLMTDTLSKLDRWMSSVHATQPVYKATELMISLNIIDIDKWTEESCLWVRVK